MFFLQAQSFLESVTIRLIHLETDIGFADPTCIGNGQRSVLGGHLLNANDDLHPYPLHCWVAVGRVHRPFSGGPWLIAQCQPEGWRYKIAASAKKIVLAGIPALEEQRGVRPAEPERVRER